MSEPQTLNDTAPEQAILVGVSLPGQTRSEVEETLEELALLADTAGATVLDRMLQDRSRVDPASYIGSGKVEELAELIKELGANLVIFDDDLSPAQLRNLEEPLGVKIIDRSRLILDIFSSRAKTREAQTQVEELFGNQARQADWLLNREFSPLLPCWPPEEHAGTLS